jgi:asparagine synthase (glutamine-hydrolysing)
MAEYMNSELNIVLCYNAHYTKEAREKFQTVFKTNHEYVFFENLFLSKGKGTQHLEKGNFQIFIHGEIYERPDIVESFQTFYNQKDKVNQALSQLNGSCIVLIIDNQSKEVYIITDRINSKRIYFYKNDSFIILTTNPRYFKSIDNEINLGGIASYLINGVVYNNNTLYRNIHALERASLHKIVNGEHTMETYWQYSFTNEYVNIPKDELKKRFAEVLIQSVSRRIKALKPDTCFISLSGGYDSRFLLGALRTLQSGYKLRTFSYGMVKKHDSGDDVIASRLAEKFGFEHHFEPAYANDLLRTISLNTRYGHGYSNFCDEVDAWLNLSKLFSEDPSSLLFVGDMFYLPYYDFGNVKDKRLPLFAAKVFPWYYIKPFLAVLPAEIQNQLITAYDEIYQNIILKLPDTNDFKIIKDFAYLDQRISHTLIYWREFFHGPFIKVAQPLLDNEVLDFFRKLPNELRYSKRLYKETLREMFPDLFDIPIAQHTWVLPSWMDKIENNKQAIFKRIIDNKSRLDDIIPSDTIMSFINNNKVDIQYKTENFIRILKKVSVQHDVLNNLLGGILLNHTHVKHSQLIIRLLILRETLEY